MTMIAIVAGEADPDRDPAAERGAEEEVAAELVRAERVRPGGRRYAIEKSTAFGSYGETHGTITT